MSAHSSIYVKNATNRLWVCEIRSDGRWIRVDNDGRFYEFYEHSEIMSERVRQHVDKGVWIELSRGAYERWCKEEFGLLTVPVFSDAEAVAVTAYGDHW